MSEETRSLAAKFERTARLIGIISGAMSIALGLCLCLVGQFLIKDRHPTPPDRVTPIVFGVGFSLFGVLIIYFAGRGRNGHDRS